MTNIKGWTKHNNLVYFNKNYVGGVAVELLNMNSSKYVVRSYNNGKVILESIAFSKIEPAIYYMKKYMEANT